MNQVTVTVDGEELFSDEAEPDYSAGFSVNGSRVEIDVQEV